MHVLYKRAGVGLIENSDVGASMGSAAGSVSARRTKSGDYTGRKGGCPERPTRGDAAATVIVVAALLSSAEGLGPGGGPSARPSFGCGRVYAATAATQARLVAGQDSVAPSRNSRQTLKEDVVAANERGMTIPDLCGCVASSSAGSCSRVHQRIQRICSNRRQSTPTPLAGGDERM